MTVQEREREEAKERAKEHEAQRAAEARRRETLRIVESTVKAEVAERRNKDSDPLGESNKPFEGANKGLTFSAPLIGRALIQWAVVSLKPSKATPCLPFISL